MKKQNTVFYVRRLALTLLIIAGVVAAALSVVNGITEPIIAKINELTAYIQMYYYEDDATIEDLKDGMYAGLVNGLGDKYSVYYTADEYEQMQVSMTGKYYGIGAALSQDADTMVVSITKVYEGRSSTVNGTSVRSKAIVTLHL